MLYLQEFAVQRYFDQKSVSPDGVLQSRYRKDRLRAMYKKDGLIQCDKKERVQ